MLVFLHNEREELLTRVLGCRPERILHPRSAKPSEKGPDDHRLQILVFPPRRGHEYPTLITSGLSDIPTPPFGRNFVPGQRSEYIMYAPGLDVASVYDSWQVNLLWEIVVFALKQLMPLPCYLAIPNGDPPQPFRPGSDLTHWFLLPPLYEQELPKPAKLAGEDVYYYWVDFITTAEFRVKKEQGLPALMEHFKATRNGPVR